jgi:hypothetical protein
MKNGHVHLLVCFDARGGADFFPDKEATREQREIIVAGLERIVKAFVADPGAIRCAAGVCDATCPHRAGGGVA